MELLDLNSVAAKQLGNLRDHLIVGDVFNLEDKTYCVVDIAKELNVITIQEIK